MEDNRKKFPTDNDLWTLHLHTHTHTHCIHDLEKSIYIIEKIGKTVIGKL